MEEPKNEWDKIIAWTVGIIGILGLLATLGGLFGN